MAGESQEKLLAKDYIKFIQGQDSLIGEQDSLGDGIKKIQSKVSDLINIKNIHFLLGAGASSDAIPAMKEMFKKVVDRIEHENFAEELEGHKINAKKFLELYGKIKDASNQNLESMLGTLYARQAYFSGVGEENPLNTYFINLIESQIYNDINIDLKQESANLSLDIYKKFYQKLSLRNKDLARVNVFTTNNDLISETALGYLNINYNNGFSSGLSRTFNPARFSYTFSRRVDSGLEKYEPIENMIYLYKLHGSISWVEADDNSFFNIKEIDVIPGAASRDNNVLIYPTPLKQNKSLGSPYADLIREFQTKLLLQHGVLIIIGYSFSDEHINNAIYAALASNASLSVVVFGDYPAENLSKLTDRRIYKISGKDEAKEGAEEKHKKIHYFKYIVENLIPDLDKNKDSELLEDFIKSMKAMRGAK